MHASMWPVRPSRPRSILRLDPPTRRRTLYCLRVGSFCIHIPLASSTIHLLAYPPPRPRCCTIPELGFGTSGKMRIFSLTAFLGAASVVVAEARTANVYIQPLGSSSAPVLLAGLTYDSSAPDVASSASVASYEAPELPGSTELVRVGIYDTNQKKWAGSTSVASAENFAKGYSPHFVLSVDGTSGEEVVLGASVRGVRIDAGQTRDFGPQASLLLTSRGKQPDLNKPIVLSPEGKKVEKEEKTFLQKFVLAPCPSLNAPCAAMALRSSRQANCMVKILVDDRHCYHASHGRRRRRGQIDMRMAEHNFGDTMHGCSFGMADDVIWVPRVLADNHQRNELLISLGRRYLPSCSTVSRFCAQQVAALPTSHRTHLSWPWVIHSASPRFPSCRLLLGVNCFASGAGLKGRGLTASLLPRAEASSPPTSVDWTHKISQGNIETACRQSTSSPRLLFSLFHRLPFPYPRDRKQKQPFPPLRYLNCQSTSLLSQLDFSSNSRNGHRERSRH